MGLTIQSQHQKTVADTTPVWKVHAALVFGQVCFGAGSVVTALGIAAVPPFVFALYREVIAGSILVGLSYYLEKGHLLNLMERERSVTKAKRHCCELDDWVATNEWASRAKQKLDVVVELADALVPPRDRTMFLVLGAMVYGNQACFLAGLKLAGPVAGAVWQPGQPLLTAGLSMALGHEPVNPRRIAALVVAFGGCAVMVASKVAAQHTSSHNTESEAIDDGESSTHHSARQLLLGNAFFLANCTCCALFVFLSRAPAFGKYPPLWITASTYSVAATIMTPTALLVRSSYFLSNLFCPECDEGVRLGQADDDDASTAYWSIPAPAYGALVYNIIFGSVVAYGILMWANKKTDTGTLVMSYTVLQPVTACVLTVVVVRILRTVPDCAALAMGDEACLDLPGWASLVGIAAVLAGLLLVVDTEPTSKSKSSEPLNGSSSHHTSRSYASEGSGRGEGHYDDGQDDVGEDDDDDDENIELEALLRNTIEARTPDPVPVVTKVRKPLEP